MRARGTMIWVGRTAAVATLCVVALAALLLLLGMGQAMSIAPQSALVGEFGRRLARPVGESTLYGIFRLVERTGSALGPILAGALLGLYGFPAAALAIGAGVAVGGALFAAAIAVTAVRPKPAGDDARREGEEAR